MMKISNTLEISLDVILKRFFDISIALIILLLTGPLFAIICILIKIDSRGPSLFYQERLGLYGKPFKIMKFRTMIMNAEHIGDGLSIKNENDTRITKVGKILRKYSLDELPQLFNILLGDMSLVGPRPPVTYHPYKGYDMYPNDMKQRFLMKPGITGLAQVTYRNSVSWEERIRKDIEYISNYSLLLDIRILIKTIIVVFDNRNIYQ